MSLCRALGGKDFAEDCAHRINGNPGLVLEFICFLLRNRPRGSLEKTLCKKQKLALNRLAADVLYAVNLISNMLALAGSRCREGEAVSTPL